MPKFWIETKDDETIELFVGERSIAVLNHDEHGWAGMNDGEKMFKKIADALGEPFEKR